MRIRLLFLIIVMAVCGSIQAVNIGYCAGEASRSGSFSVGGNTEVSGAVYLTPSFLTPYDGCEIKAMRGALASKVNIDRLTLWVRESLEGSNLAEAVITSSSTPSLSKGWMDASLDRSITIDASKGLYIGMTYHQKGESKAFSLIGNGSENSFFVSIGDEGWEDRHDEGILSIEAVVEGDAKPDYDLALLEAALDYSSDPDWNIVTARVSNNGKNAVSGFTLEYAYANSTEDAVSRHYDEVLEPGDKCDVVCPLPKVTDVFTNPVCVSITDIDEGVDSYEGNNSTVARVPSQKKVLVEEFTTEKCSNCPRVAQYMHEVCEEDAYKDRVVVVCHHAGFYTDWLTQDCDEEIGWIYGCGFAPAVMYDRTPLPGGDMADTPSTKDLRDNFDRQLSVAPSIGISLTTEMDMASGKLRVNVALKRERSISMTDPRISVYLTEDNIRPFVQSGDKDRTHIHQHVIRAYNSTWGDPIEWAGSDYNVSYSFDIDEKWKIDDLKVIALVNNYDSDNKANNKVDNAECCRVSCDVDSVDVLHMEEEGYTVYYDLSGHRTAYDARGFLIKVCGRPDGTVSATKVFNP